MKKEIKIFFVLVLLVVCFNSCNIFAANNYKISDNGTTVTISGEGKTFNFTQEEFKSGFGLISYYSNNEMTADQLRYGIIDLYTNKIEEVQDTIEFNLPNRLTETNKYEKESVEFLDGLINIINRFESLGMSVDSYYATYLEAKTKDNGAFEYDDDKNDYNTAIDNSKKIINSYLSIKNEFEKTNTGYVDEGNAGTSEGTNSGTNTNTGTSSDPIYDTNNNYQQGTTPPGSYRPIDPSSGNNVNNDVKKAVDRVWSTVIVIVQIVSVACVVLAGVRYMYASADKKAEIKKGLMYLAIGAIFVFAASTVIRFIYFGIGGSIIQ